MGIKGDFAKGGSEEFKEENPNIDSPSGDLMMHHFSKFKSIPIISNKDSNAFLTVDVLT